MPSPDPPGAGNDLRQLATELHHQSARLRGDLSVSTEELRRLLATQGHRVELNLRLVLLLVAVNLVSVMAAVVVMVVVVAVVAGVLVQLR